MKRMKHCTPCVCVCACVARECGDGKGSDCEGNGCDSASGRSRGMRKKNPPQQKEICISIVIKLVGF